VSRARSTERFVEANGVRLHCIEWGSVRKPPVLLVHGWDGTARYWDLVAPMLGDRYHLIAVTLRGRGRSGEDPFGNYRFDDYVTDLDEVTRRFRLTRFAFVGASLGGMLALSYVARFPWRVERLVLGDIGAQLGGDRPSSYYAGMLDAPETFSSRTAIDDWLRQWSLYVKLPHEGMTIVVREHFRKDADGQWRWRFGQRLRALQREHPRETLFPAQWANLSSIRCPTLIVRGGRSESLLPEVAERTRIGLRDALLVEIPGCSHFPFLERPGEFAVLLRGFLA
jgi:esterase